MALRYSFLHSLQSHDEHNAKRHSLDVADDEHGQILEGPTCDLRYAQAGRRAYQIRSVQETATYGRCLGHQVGAGSQENFSQNKQKVKQQMFSVVFFPSFALTFLSHHHPLYLFILSVIYSVGIAVFFFSISTSCLKLIDKFLEFNLTRQLCVKWNLISKLELISKSCWKKQFQSTERKSNFSNCLHIYLQFFITKLQRKDCRKNWLQMKRKQWSLETRRKSLLEGKTKLNAEPGKRNNELAETSHEEESRRAHTTISPEIDDVEVSTESDVGS